MISLQHCEIAKTCLKKVFVYVPTIKIEMTEFESDTLCVGDLFVRETENGRYVVERMTIQHNYPDAMDSVDIHPVNDADHPDFMSALMHVVAQHAVDIFSIALEDTL